MVHDEKLDRSNHFILSQHMCFWDFLEAMCLVADMTGLPTYGDVAYMRSQGDECPHPAAYMHQVSVQETDREGNVYSVKDPPLITKPPISDSKVKGASAREFVELGVGLEESTALQREQVPWEDVEAETRRRQGKRATTAAVEKLSLIHI